MKMSILEMEYKNIRKIDKLKLSFFKPDGSTYKTSFVMMANGAGKTTTITLLKALLDGTAANWGSEKVKSFRPQKPTNNSDTGEFSVTVEFDEKKYKYFLGLDYAQGKASIDTLFTPHGRESSLHFPESFKGIFTSEFVSRFIFDGEQVEKSMDSSSSEAEEMIKTLYKLDEFDKIIATNRRILTEIQNINGSRGSDSSLSNLRSRHNKVKETLRKLNEQDKEYRNKLEAHLKQKGEKERQRDKIDRKYEQLNNEKNDILRQLSDNKNEIESTISEILSLTKSPYLLNKKLCDRMVNFREGMTRLKLPKSSSKDFFVELANSSECVCGRCIGSAERNTILKNAERYLGSDQQTVLNIIKGCLLNCKFDDRLSLSFDKLSELVEKDNKLNNQRIQNEENLIKAGGKEAQELKGQIDKLSEAIGAFQANIKTIESRDDSDETLNEDNNLYVAGQRAEYYENEIAKATNTNEALQRKEIVEKLILSIKERSTAELKKQIISKSNEKLKAVITDDNIEIVSIDKFIKLKGRNGASEGQTLGVAYCFLGTLFEDSELEFPFVIDSPTGKMDLEKRAAVAEIIPNIFEQMITFVQSAEKERFADQFYEKDNAQFLTVVSSPDDGTVSLREGVEFFDSYQQDNKGDDQ